MVLGKVDSKWLQPQLLHATTFLSLLVGIMFKRSEIFHHGFKWNLWPSAILSVCSSAVTKHAASWLPLLLSGLNLSHSEANASAGSTAAERACDLMHLDSEQQLQTRCLLFALAVFLSYLILLTVQCLCRKHDS